MHDGDKFCSELSLDIMGDMLNGGGNGVPGGEWGVHDDTEVFDLEVSLV